MNIFIIIMLFFATLGLLDMILGGKLGYAPDFERGLTTMGGLSLSVVGLFAICVSFVQNHAEAIAAGTAGLPFDPSLIRPMTKSIQASDLGLTPNDDGKAIRLMLPPLTEERRKDLAKQVSVRLEEARVAIRNVRRDIIKDLKDAEKEKLITEDDRKKGEEKIQKLTDTWTAKVDEVGKKKEKEIMEV